MGRRSTYRKDRFALRDPSTWRGAPRLPAGLALVAMCLLGMVALPNWSASQSGRLHEEIRGTLTPLEVTLERLHREVLDLANDLRGYLLTSDPVFLVSVDVQRRRIEADLARAGAFAARAEPALADGLGRARAAYEDWLVHSRVAMSLGRQGDLPRARERALSAASLRRLDVFSAEMDGLTELTRAREGELRERLVQFQRVERILMLILGTLAAVVVAYLGWLMLALVRARTAALEERDQLEAVLGSVDSGIVLLDRDLRVLAANGRASELLGVPQEVLVGGDQRRIASERLKPRMADPASFEKRLLHLYDNPDAVAEDRVEVALPETRLLSRYSSPVRDESGAIFGRIEVYRDVTESLRRERELEEANERKDRFVATLSHELRTPLTPILGWLELLRREQDPQTRARGLDAIERNVVLEAQLVEDLLDLSRVVNQKLELAFTRMHVGEAIAAAVDTVRHLADAKGVRLEVASPGVPLAIEADETRFIQVIWNLVSNAIKFTPPGGLVRVAARAHGERLVVSVHDEGEGIRPELLEHIFKPFEQDLRQGQGRGGLGIGLALCRSLVELHGGSIAAESEGPGQGARFSFWLPLAGSPGVAAAPAGRGLRVRAEALLPHRRNSGAEAAPARAGAGSGSNGGAVRSPPGTPRSSPGGGALTGEDWAGTRRRLLLVEDNPDTLEAMRILLSAWGYGVTAASNVAQAREVLSRGGQEVVISDIGMPHVDGMAWAREVRSREATEDGGRRLALVAISGYASQADRRGALEAGFDAYVTKPIDFVSLKAILDRLAPAPTRSTRA